MKETFREVNFKPETLKTINRCIEIVEEYQEQGLRLTLRQLYYQLVSRDLFPADRRWSRNSAGKWVLDLERGSPNADPNYKWLGGIVSDARLAGLMDWDAIEDRGRQPRSASEWNSVAEIVESALAAYRLPRWRGQDNYVELWVEKDALAGVLWPIAHRYHVTLMVNRGYSSLSAMYESAKRIERETADGQEPHILYLGDHDPSGEDMVRDIRDRLSMFGVEANVSKVALTTAQVEEHNPPENPVKLSDSRANGYIARHGEHCWEVDALAPPVLRDLIDEAFARLVDMDKMDAIKAREEKDKAALKKAAEKIAK